MFIYKQNCFIRNLFSSTINDFIKPISKLNNAKNIKYVIYFFRKHKQKKKIEKKIRL